MSVAKAVFARFHTLRMDFSDPEIQAIINAVLFKGYVVCMIDRPSKQFSWVKAFRPGERIFIPTFTNEETP